MGIKAPKRREVVPGTGVPPVDSVHGAVRSGVSTVRWRDYFAAGAAALSLVAAACADLPQGRAFRVGEDTSGGDVPVLVRGGNTDGGQTLPSASGDGGPDPEGLDKVSLGELFNGPFEMTVDTNGDGVILGIMGNPWAELQFTITPDVGEEQKVTLRPGNNNIQVRLSPEVGALSYTAVASEDSSYASGNIPVDRARELQDRTSAMGNMPQ